MSEYYNLGKHSLKVTTTSSGAQIWFDRGLRWCYGFNHGEAVNCFRRALEADPHCAIAYWGVAYALGPNYNKAWDAFDEVEFKSVLAEAHEANSRAITLIDGVSEMERALIHTLRHRYPTTVPGSDTSVWVEEYANEMRNVYRRFPEHPDVGTLFAEALLNRTPWKLWDLETGRIAENSSTAEATEVLETALARVEDAGDPLHPGLLHMYIHLMEMSPHPERVLKAADQLRDLVPDAGHLQHMPTHIYVLCGQYQTVVDCNNSAIVADRKFFEREGALNFYSLYRCHNYHFKIYGAMFLGQYRPAIETTEEMISTLTADLLRVQSPPMADWLEGFVSIKQHVLIRFGKWDEIIAQKLPFDQELFCVTTAMMHYAMAVAYSSSGDLPSAENEAALFDEALSRVPDSRYIFNNTCLDILAVAREMMLGEIEYRHQNFEAAFAHLRKSVELDDNLPYDEPWGWMQPTRHALAALLMEQGHFEEATRIYRADLGYDDTLSRACQHPDNVWSLHGYNECLVRLGRIAEAEIIGQRLKLVSARTDVRVTASCFCRQEAQI
jgi:tetratricopeptide (TPR) repeat protein